MNDALGAVYTPPVVAELLSNWAIQSSSDRVLDLGIGEGVFVFAAHQRLVGLGADTVQAAAQIYGTELNGAIYDKFLQHATTMGLESPFPHLGHGDFFQSSFPQVDAVIGNPPYVRRRVFSTAEIEQIRNRVLSSIPDIDTQDISGLTDLYVYFLLLGADRLRPGGRLAVIAADSWLNVRYGHLLKRYLKAQFTIERMISIDQTVFADAQVRPVLLFAVKSKEAIASSKVAFTRVTDGLAARSLNDLFRSPETTADNVNTRLVSAEKLKIDDPWGVHFKISEISEQIASHDWFIPLHQIAHTRIGVQTLAKDFFSLTLEQVRDWSIEPSFLKPFAYSVAQFEKPVIDERTEPSSYIFFCSKSKRELARTQALAYIESGEKRQVGVRGKSELVQGYHRKERIRKANRPYWYDVRTEIERRGCASILIPRLIYDRYLVLWNRAEFVPGGTVIEFMPTVSLQSEERDVQLFLAILNSTLIEVLVRGYAQMYGGGTYSVGLSQIRSLPIPDVTRITESQQDILIEAYQSFLVDGQRCHIDNAIWDLLGLDAGSFLAAVQDLRLMAVMAKKKHVQGCQQ